MGLLNKGKKKFKCSQDPNTKNVQCTSSRELEDGTEEVLAEAEFTMDANCNFIPGHMQENEEGELDSLMSKATPHLKSKCPTNRPKDY